jgi:GT2 family glycosyltransferase
MKQGLVSAIVLSFNRKEETLACLAALEGQSYERVEIVVVDNGSVDGSADAIAAEFPEVRLIRLPENLGAWGPRDTAIANSEGEYIFMIDNDAVCDADAVEKLVARMEESDQIGIVQPRITDLDGVTVYDMGFGRDKADFEFYRWQFHGCAALIRREAYDWAGGFPHHYHVAGGEGYLSVPMIGAGFRILYHPEVTIRHELSPKERIPRQRFLMSNLHRMQNTATFNPSLARVFIDFAWKLLFFAIGCVRNGYLGMLPTGLCLHVAEFVRTLRFHRRPISRQAQRLVDYLCQHQVRTSEDYEDVDLSKVSWSSVVAHRFWR